MNARPLFDHVVAEVSLTLGAATLSEVAGGVVATWRALTIDGIEYPARVRWMPARPDRIEAMLSAYDGFDAAAGKISAVVELPAVAASVNPRVNVRTPEEMLRNVRPVKP